MSLSLNFITTDELKARLPVTYVLHDAGCVPVDRQGRDIRYLTPWRHDTNPSLACYPAEDHGIVDRWKDMARGDGGDIFDMIQQIMPGTKTFPELADIARALLAEMETSGWEAPEPLPVGGQFNLDEARADLERQRLASDRGSLLDWLRARDDATSLISPAWLHGNFGVFMTADGEVRAPYGDEGLYKYRKPGEKFMSPAGTRGMWTFFYGEHLDRDVARPVVLCEGEPDVWSGTHSTQDYVFLGLPTGAGARPEKLQSRLVGRRVLLAFDADTAGRDATLIWAEHLLSNDCIVDVVPLPAGSDLSDMPDIPLVLSKARTFRPLMPGLLAVGDSYLRATRDGNPGQVLSDFVVSPVRVMIGETGALSYEVTVANKTQLLTHRDLGSKKAMQLWAASLGLSWSGSDTDTVVLGNNLAVESLFVPVESAAPVEGWHEGQFVWADGYLGQRPMRHVPTGVHAGLDIRLPETGKPNSDELSDLLALGPSDVIHPMIAWAAAAPWRARYKQFPILNVAGASGSGKTTLLEQIIPRISGSYTQHTLTSTTKFAVEALISSTNAFPVVFDEYRPGARTDSLQALEQLIRDVYDGQGSMKSKGGDRWMETQEIHTQAPLVVAGEQSISETSHAERMILVHLTRSDVRSPKHVAALRNLREYEPRLARDYLTWIAYRGGDEAIITAPDRVEYNLEMLRFGWAALREWAFELGWHDVMPAEPDLSGVIATTTQVTSTNPVREALAWALGDRYASENVWVDGDELCVQVSSFVRDVRSNGTFVLPGNNGRTIADYLLRQYSGFETKRTHPDDFSSKRKNVIVVSNERVFPDEVD